MLMNRETSSLLIVDVQARLAPAIHDGERVVANCAWLAAVAGRVGVPVVVTEHCRDKLGETVTAVKDAAATASYVGKTWFSAQTDGCLRDTVVEGRRQVVVCGAETHVCVLQTALELRWAGKEVFVVAEACGSRTPADRELAFARMRAHGIEVVGREMVAFEWLRQAGTELFRGVSRDFIR